MKLVSEARPLDVIDDLLASLRVRTSVYCQTDFRAPWGFAVRAQRAAAFHVVVRGSCLLEVEGVDEPIELTEGDVVILATGRRHQLRADLDSSIEWLDDILSVTPVERGRMSYGGAGDITQLVCGGLAIEGEHAAPTLLLLPPLMRLTGSETDRWLTGTLELMRIETERRRAGSEAVLTRIADVLLTHTIRTYIASLAGEEGSKVGAM